MLIIAVLYTLIVNAPAEPIYEGKALSVWLRELAPAYPAETRAQAKEAVRAIGTNAFSTLLVYISAEDDSFEGIVRTKWERVIKGSASTPPFFKRMQAISGFEALGSLGRGAIPKLEQIMTRGQCPIDAGRALGFIKAEETIPFMIDFLNRSAPGSRASGCAALGAMGKQAQVAVPKLLQLISNDQDEVVRANAVEAMGSIATADVAVPILLATIQHDQSSMVRGSAVYTLGSFPERASEIDPVLRTAVADKSANVRVAAQLALQRIRDALKKQQEGGAPNGVSPKPGQSSE